MRSLPALSIRTQATYPFSSFFSPISFFTIFFFFLSTAATLISFEISFAREDNLYYTASFYRAARVRRGHLRGDTRGQSLRKWTIDKSKLIGLNHFCVYGDTFHAGSIGSREKDWEEEKSHPCEILKRGERENLQIRDPIKS